MIGAVAVLSNAVDLFIVGSNFTNNKVIDAET